MPELSVIIPIYNTPLQSLSSCFHSLVPLEGISWEAILIDDGSREEVGSFCRDYVAEHPQFRYFYKENGGVSSARNLGLDQAQGNYVMFVDADDVLLCDPIVHALQNASGDMIFFDMELVVNGVARNWPALPHPAGPVSKEQVLCSLIRCNDISGPCAKLLRRDLLEEHNLRFSPQFISGEDWLFVSETTVQAQTFRYVPAVCYRYLYSRSTGNSRLTRFPDKLLSNVILRQGKKEALLEYISPENRHALAVASAALQVENLFNLASDMLLAKLLTSDRKKQIREAVSALNLYIPHIPRKSRIKGNILLRYPLVLRFAAVARKFYLSAKR